MGDAVSGDYRTLAHEGCLDSVTNYELFKGLWSSFNDKNFYEITWTLKGQFAPDGLYPHLALYNFADNHDVNRVASLLHNPSHLFPLYGILFCAPGIPSLYYGSEYGIYGERDAQSDHALRPMWDDSWRENGRGAELFRAISGFARIRRGSSALRYGGYRELYVGHEQFAFLRESGEERVIAAVNAAGETKVLFIPARDLALPPLSWRDVLSGEIFAASDHGLSIPVYPSWLRILEAINM